MVVSPISSCHSTHLTRGTHSYIRRHSIQDKDPPPVDIDTEADDLDTVGIVVVNVHVENTATGVVVVANSAGELEFRLLEKFDEKTFQTLQLCVSPPLTSKPMEELEEFELW